MEGPEKLRRTQGSDKPKGSRRLTACFISPHPLVLAELGRLLPPHEYDVKTCLLESYLNSSLQHPSLPRASAYIVDSYAPRPAAALIAEIMDHSPRAHVLAVAERFGQASAFLLLRGRAKGLLTYEEVRTRLPHALEVVTAGGFWVPRGVLSKFVDSVLRSEVAQHSMGPARELSRREQEVLEGVLGNQSNKEIAQELGITERTAKFHVSNLMSKFKVRRRADLILLHFQRSLGSAAG